MDVFRFSSSTARFFVSPPISAFVGNRETMERLQIENDSLAKSDAA